ncbi:MAG: flagellar FlbD family protein [Clostridiales bacterium]|jgi:flagellar protein FlbD|nr:flagellar FlbD family protein [Clostridiales bacterium]
MITITKLNDQQIVVNSDLIELIESTPDTTITMTTGRKIIAREPVEEIMSRIIGYRKRVFQSVGALENREQ